MWRFLGNVAFVLIAVVASSVLRKGKEWRESEMVMVIMPSPVSVTVDEVTLKVICSRLGNQPSCDPYWTSSDPSRIAVRGNRPVVINGATFWFGDSASTTRIR